jgi:hypothetical protein
LSVEDLGVLHALRLVGVIRGLHNPPQLSRLGDGGLKGSGPELADLR